MKNLKRFFKINVFLLLILICLIIGSNSLNLIQVNYYSYSGGINPQSSTSTYNLCNTHDNSYCTTLEDLNEIYRKEVESKLIEDDIDRMNNKSHPSKQPKTQQITLTDNDIKQYVISFIKLIVCLIALNFIAWLLVKKKHKILICLLFIFTNIFHWDILMDMRYMIPTDITIFNLDIPIQIFMGVLTVNLMLIIYILCKFVYKKDDIKHEH